MKGYTNKSLVLFKLKYQFANELFKNKYKRIRKNQNIIYVIIWENNINCFKVY